MYINRGNHEAKDMNRTYGFEGEAKHKHGEQSYKVSDGTIPFSATCPHAPAALRTRLHSLYAPIFHQAGDFSNDQSLLVPLATLINATQAPVRKAGDKAILSPQGLKRYFVVHGGLFSKDEVTLDDIRKIPRIGRQPGQEGLMCKSCHCLLFVLILTFIYRRGMAFGKGSSTTPTTDQHM